MAVRGPHARVALVHDTPAVDDDEAVEWPFGHGLVEDDFAASFPLHHVAADRRVGLGGERCDGTPAPDPGDREDLGNMLVRVPGELAPVVPVLEGDRPAQPASLVRAVARRSWALRACARAQE